MAASSSSVHQNLGNHASENWILKPAFGSGREVRTQAVEKFFRELPRSYGQASQLLEDIKSKDSLYKCRVLCSGDAPPKAVVVFFRALSKSREFTNGVLEVKIASLLNQENESIYSILIDQLKEEASSLRADAIYITLDKTNQTAIRHFKELGFRQKGEGYLGEMGESNPLFVFELPKQIKRGREREDEKAETSEVIKRTKTQLEPQAPRQPIGHPRHVTLKRVYIHHIRNGTKTIEGRVASGMFNNIQVGNLLRFFYFQDASDDVICKVTKMTRYVSFTEMLQKEGYKNCVPEARSLEEAIQIYHSIPNYTEKARSFGVFAIGLKVEAKTEE